VKRKDLRGLAHLRLREAKILLTCRCWEGAYYLAGYAAECGLKACIAKKTERHEFPERQKVLDSYTHKLDPLLRLAGLETAMQAASPEVRSNCNPVRNWSEESRYRNPGQNEAEELIAALDSRIGGFFRWLRKHW
jgi:HEPN domain-containing protein